MKKNKKGFSLIELLLSLAVLITIITAAFFIYKKVDLSIKQKKLIDKLELIYSYSKNYQDYSIITFKEEVLQNGENVISDVESKYRYSFPGVIGGIPTIEHKVTLNSPLGKNIIYQTQNTRLNFNNIFVNSLDYSSCVKVVNRFAAIEGVPTIWVNNSEVNNFTQGKIKPIFIRKACAAGKDNNTVQISY